MGERTMTSWLPSPGRRTQIERLERVVSQPSFRTTSTVTSRHTPAAKSAIGPASEKSDSPLSAARFFHKADVT